MFVGDCLRKRRERVRVQFFKLLLWHNCCHIFFLYSCRLPHRFSIKTHSCALSVLLQLLIVFRPASSSEVLSHQKSYFYPLVLLRHHVPATAEESGYFLNLNHSPYPPVSQRLPGEQLKQKRILLIRL